MLTQEISGLLWVTFNSSRPWAASGLLHPSRQSSWTASRATQSDFPWTHLFNGSMNEYHSFPTTHLFSLCPSKHLSPLQRGGGVSWKLLSPGWSEKEDLLLFPQEVEDLHWQLSMESPTHWALLPHPEVGDHNSSQGQFHRPLVYLSYWPNNSLKDVQAFGPLPSSLK